MAFTFFLGIPVAFSFPVSGFLNKVCFLIVAVPVSLTGAFVVNILNSIRYGKSKF